MGKKSRIKRNPQKFGRKYASHPVATAGVPAPEVAAAVVETIVKTVVAAVAAPIVEAAEEVQEVVSELPKAFKKRPLKKTTPKK